MEKIPEKGNEEKSPAPSAADTEITVHNIKPIFSSAEAMENEKREIAQMLYRIFSKYNESC